MSGSQLVLPPIQPTVQSPDSQPLPKFDTLTLREWFNKMDEDRTGSITKPRWLEFLRRNPEFRTIILGRGMTKLITKVSFKNLHEEARQLRQEKRHLGHLWTELDTDGNGTLEWDEFLEFFSKTGRLLVYETKDNPRDRLAEMLQEMHEQQDDLASEAERKEFHDLAKKNLDLGRRRSLGAAVEEAKAGPHSDSGSDCGSSTGSSVSDCGSSTGSLNPKPPSCPRPQGLVSRSRHSTSDDGRLGVELPSRGRPRSRQYSVPDASDQVCMCNRMQEFSVGVGIDCSIPAPIAVC
eukprot:gnl/TRDRNA2_/TRDRNA2_84410_c0_seq1.p1 gnl/TRDRNA2_/TRDRNA2_84410_c0~~gnl/TRDRNA2_/TRDRNA2_84410_c0_seq1.p1  ORF type:complete len:314 (+),score=31.00 gnl/TRDRNA2_/TRDRNA2_84410_c0_seq1:64-942(+)